MAVRKRTTSLKQSGDIQVERCLVSPTAASVKRSIVKSRGLPAGGPPCYIRLSHPPTAEALSELRCSGGAFRSCRSQDRSIKL